MALCLDASDARLSLLAAAAAQVMIEDEFRGLAMALAGTVEVQHFKRQAFKARRILATLDLARNEANVYLPPELQEHWCMLLPDALSPVPNAWGAKGWTRVRLDQVEATDIQPFLCLA